MNGSAAASVGEMLVAIAVTTASTFVSSDDPATMTQEAAATACQIGSIPMPSADWLIGGAALFQQNYGQVHPYLAAFLCVVGLSVWSLFG